jgi:signal transduction histidine kinase
LAGTFPTTPRAPGAVRLGAIVIGLAAVALGTWATIGSLRWIDRVFPGFLLLDNRVIASIDLPHWPGTQVPGLYQSEVVAVDGRPVATTHDVYAYVARLAPGTVVHYRLRRAEGTDEVEVPTLRFQLYDWLLIFGAYLLNSLVYLASGLVVWVLRPRAPLGRALLLFGSTCALWALTALDLYDPAHLFRLHVIGEAMFPASGLHLLLLFPQPHRLARFAWAPYAISLALLVPYELFLYEPRIYTLAHNACTLYLGVDAVLFGARLVLEYRRGRSALARQRVRVMTLGTLFGFALPGVVLIASAAVGGGIAINIVALTGFLFALSLAYAIVKHDLFEIDAMVKRGAYYLLLTGAVGATYVGAFAVFNLVLQAQAITTSPAFPIVVTLTVLLFLDPLRARLQGFVDRVFFRTRYDGAQVLAAVGAQLAATLTREDIANLLCEAVEAAIPNGRTRVFVDAGDGRGLAEVGGAGRVPDLLLARLAEGRVLTAFDPAELYADQEEHEAVRAALATLEAEVALAMPLANRVVGVLTAGPKRSGLFYTGGDAEFLRALAHQAAIALQNAASYEALIELNARLEERVRERTAQLEGANRELAEAYAELKTAEVQLVQSEKMASLGRLVAGVAHEINNPVSFIATSVVPLRRRLERAADGATPDLRKLLAEAQEIVDVMGRGADRTAAIVKDLRSFSRLHEAERKRVDLHDGLDVTLRLLESRWRDRVTIHRRYGPLPLVECDPGQMNQALMNILANACDAAPAGGNVWVETAVVADGVRITVRDDGPGMAPDVARRIFDPFFTTKDVGTGTGLGLAISHGIVAAHGGRIEVETAPGAGATFHVVLPVVAGASSLDRAASGSG